MVRKWQQQSVLPFGAESRASGDHSNLTVVQPWRELFASSARLVAELQNADSPFLCVVLGLVARKYFFRVRV